VISPDPLSPTSSTSSAMKTPEHIIGPWWPWTGRWRRYPNGTLLWLVVQPKYRSSKSLGQYTYCLIIQNIKKFGTYLVLCKLN
jgi:hypothetical protein